MGAIGPGHTHKVNMKVPFGGGGSHNHNNTTYRQDNLLMADLAFTYQRGGKLNLVKSRMSVPTKDVPIEEATAMFSRILSAVVFKNNELKMFKEGLKQQIESAINIAIQTFHESR